MTSSPQIYLAGPDVFYPDAAVRFAQLRASCEDRGLLGVSPLEEDEQSSNVPSSLTIYQSNIARLRSAQGVLANLNPFRSGVEPDSGTVFEVGFAAALGLPVAGWLSEANLSYLDRVQIILPLERKGDQFIAADGFIVEDFGHPLNLMLAHGATLFASQDAALDWLADTITKSRFI